MKSSAFNILFLVLGFVGIPIFIEGLSPLKPSTSTIEFLIAGLVGMPICLCGWQRSHQHLWLFGVGIFAYFLLASVREIALKSRGQ